MNTLQFVLLATMTMLFRPMAGRAESWDRRTDTNSQWVTQDWPEPGQHPSGGNNITAPFISGPVTTATGPSPLQAWKKTLSSGAFVGPAAVGFHPASLSLFGPQGFLFAFVSSLSSGIDLAALGTVTGTPPPFPFSFYGDPRTFDTGCGTYAGTPVITTLPETYPFEDKTTTPKILGGEAGISFVFGLSTDSNCPELRRDWVWQQYFRFGMVSAMFPAYIPAPDSISLNRDGLVGQHHAHFEYSPVRDGDFLYYASTNKNCRDCGDYGPAAVYATNWKTMSDLWVIPLQTGSGLTTPTPIGQPPPPPSERFHASTRVAVKDDLLVVGAVKYSDNDDYETGYALIAYNTRDGTQRWIFRTDAKVTPNPVITDQLVIFGTANGRAYALQHSATDPTIDGKVRWQTSYPSRLTYATFPLSQIQARADAVLYGPSLDSSGQYAYFGGSDGRIHRFSTQSGGVVDSKTLLLFAEGTSWSSCSFTPNLDVNRNKIIRPCLINSAPAVFGDKFLVVKCFTQRHNSLDNGAYICILNLPDLVFNSRVTNFGSGLRVRRSDAVFSSGGQNYGLVSMNDNSCSPILDYDPILQLQYLGHTGTGGFYINTDRYGGKYSPEDSGGVSIADGYVIATDKAGQMIAIPSAETVKAGVADVTIAPSTTPGPPIYNPPLVLGPIQIYPNPFNPSTAVGGTLKFNNLPAGSYVELYTLAYERVRSIKELNYSARWDGKNEAGQIVAAGTYLYKIFLPDNKPPVSGRIALVRK